MSFGQFNKKQIEKYINPYNDKFFNFCQQKVIVYIEKVDDSLRKEYNEVVKQMLSKGVRVVNSLEELKTVMDTWV